MLDWVFEDLDKMVRQHGIAGSNFITITTLVQSEYEFDEQTQPPEVLSTFIDKLFAKVEQYHHNQNLTTTVCKIITLVMDKLLDTDLNLAETHLEYKPVLLRFYAYFASICRILHKKTTHYVGSKRKMRLLNMVDSNTLWVSALDGVPEYVRFSIYFDLVEWYYSIRNREEYQKSSNFFQSYNALSVMLNQYWGIPD